MKTFTNHTAGPRGINIKGGSTRWLEPGESAEIDESTIVGELPDFGKPGDGTSEQADELDRLRARVSELESENSVLTAKLAGLDPDGDGKAGEAATADEIKTAVGLLDKGNDDHWTAAGLPAVEAVAELTGKSVTRAAIKDAAPDALRPL